MVDFDTFGLKKKTVAIFSTILATYDINIKKGKIISLLYRWTQTQL